MFIFLINKKNLYYLLIKERDMSSEYLNNISARIENILSDYRFGSKQSSSVPDTNSFTLFYIITGILIGALVVYFVIESCEKEKEDE
jgi:hypothetical protein